MMKDTVVSRHRVIFLVSCNMYTIYLSAVRIAMVVDTILILFERNGY